MSRHCSICEHDKRAAIEEAIARRVPYRRIAERYGVSISAVSRHLRTHVPEQLEALVRERRPSTAETGERFNFDSGDFDFEPPEVTP